jgi:hypothetical protein
MEYVYIPIVEELKSYLDEKNLVSIKTAQTLLLHRINRTVKQWIKI